MNRAAKRWLIGAAVGIGVAGLLLFLVTGPALRDSSGLAGSVGLGALDAPELPKAPFSWRLIDGKHWQIISANFEEPATTDMREGNRGACPEGMVQVEGEMKLDPDTNPYSAGRIGKMQLTTCVAWLSKDYPERCLRFDRQAWLEQSGELATQSMRFCIDRFEYPNRKGQYPIVYASWYESAEACQREGKRLCSEDEWTFACEGPEAKPYPYGDGYVRDPAKCITDERWTAFNEKALDPRDGDKARDELDRLWRGMASGSQGACRSDLGVYDMTGNVDEWTRSSRRGERPSILKGGYWGPVRTRCRPATRSHDQNHAFYQQGLRCCADVGTKTWRPGTVDPSTAPLPRQLK